MNDLNEILFGDEVQEKERYEIDSMDRVNWAIGKISRAEDKIQQVELLYQKYIKKLNDWKESATKDDKQTIETLTEMARPFLQTEIYKQGKKKSIKLLGATAQIRKSQDRVDIFNEPTALAWCKDNLPDAVKIVESLLKTPIKKAIESGSKIPGVSLEPVPARFNLVLDDQNLLEGIEND